MHHHRACLMKWYLKKLCHNAHPYLVLLWLVRKFQPVLGCRALVFMSSAHSLVYLYHILQCLEFFFKTKQVQIHTGSSFFWVWTLAFQSFTLVTSATNLTDLFSMSPLHFFFKIFNFIRITWCTHTFTFY